MAQSKEEKSRKVKEYRKVNKIRIQEQRKNYRRRNREKLLEEVRAWQRANPENLKKHNKLIEVNQYV